MSDKTRERLTEHLLYETKEGADITQLENMTGLSRKIVSTLENFDRKHQDSPDATPIMEYLKKETGITDEKIILSNVINILKYRRNDTAVGKYGIEKKSLVNMEIYNYCTTLINGYEKIVEEITNTQKDISEIFEAKKQEETQLNIDIPEEN